MTSSGLSTTTAPPPAPRLLRETQATIMAWKRQTFGPSTPQRTLARAAEELGKVFRAVTSEAPPIKIAEEAAGVALILADIGEWLGVGDWLFGAVEPRIYGPVKLCGFALTQLGYLTREIEYIASGEVPRSRSVALRELRALLGALKEISSIYGMSLESAIDAKMAINRGRDWVCDGTGHGYHRRPAEGGAL